MNASRLPIEPASMADGRPHRPLTVCYPFAGDVMGGSHVSLRGLLDGLDRDEIRIIIVPEVPDGRLTEHYAAYEQIPDPSPPDRPFEAGVPFGVSEFFRTLPSVMKRARFLKEHGVDIVHTNDGRSHASWALPAKIAGAKLLWHHRGNPTARGLRFVAPLLADRIVTVSSFALPRTKRGSARSARVVHSPFDVSITVDRVEARKRILSELDLAEDTVICGYFGTFIDRKKPLEFIETVELLAELEDRPVVGLLFGEAVEPELGRAVEERVKASEGTAILMGYRTPGHEWLGGCDLLLVPAIEEPLGRTLVEAMLVGTPVVATHSGGNPEALRGDCGIFVPPGDCLAMARTAHELLADDLRRSDITERARVSAKDRFSRERHVAAIEAIYHELVQ